MLSPRFHTVALCLCLSAFACNGDSDDDQQSTGAVSAGATAADGGTSGRAAAGGGTGGRATSTAGSRAVDGGPAGADASAAGAKAAGSSGASAGSGAAGSGGASALEDAGVDDPDAGVSCEGEIVSGPERCLQDDAFCKPLADGRYCTGPSAPTCPKSSVPIAKDAACPARSECFDQSESLRCVRRLYTLEECAAAGGDALADPGDGSLVCPNDAAALGAIVGAGWDEGGLCCPAAKQCGARAGDTCKADEYCGYQPGQLCGQADAQATCRARPADCSGPSAAVCGCDQRTYPSACEANRAGTGIFADGACQ